MTEYQDFDDAEYREYFRSYNKNLNVPPHIHVMNKNEAKLMRRLQSETGMTEEEIRKIRKYRVMLSDAQKIGQTAKRDMFQKLRDEAIKRVCRKLKLPKEHPDVLNKYIEDWSNYCPRFSHCHWGLRYRVHKEFRKMTDEYAHLIGHEVLKDSGKPFKSGSKVNTVKDIILHPLLDIPAFVFYEDDSYVECRQCSKAEENVN